MPELPEVECLVRTFQAALTNKRIETITFLRKDLRYPIPIKPLKRALEGATVRAITRRSKFMLWEMDSGYAVFHLGMSGNFFQEKSADPVRPHTHAVFKVAGSKPLYLHYVDPRRFGIIDLCPRDALATYRFFIALGPEPLEKADLGLHLHIESRGRKVPVKGFVMNAATVVGVGNIYASESLFRAGLHPLRLAGTLTREDYERLATAIQETLTEAITAGGTTFRDYRHTDGTSGYFRMQLHVYDRENEPCHQCETLIAALRLTGRSTFFCPKCQPKGPKIPQKKPKPSALPKRRDRSNQ